MDSDSDFEEDYVFVTEQPIEAKRDRDSDDEDAGPVIQRPRGLPSLEEDIVDFKRIILELEAIREEPLVSVSGQAVEYVLGLVAGTEIDDNRPFNEFESLAIRFNRVRDVFRKLVPTDILNFGKIVRRFEGNENSAYRDLVANVVAFYTKDEVPNNVVVQTTPTVFTDTKSRMLTKSVEKTNRAYQTFATRQPVSEPFVSFSRLFVDEYMVGFAEVQTAAANSETTVQSLGFSLDPEGGVLDGVSKLWVIEHQKRGPVRDFSTRYLGDPILISEWAYLAVRYSHMLTGGLVMSKREMDMFSSLIEKGESTAETLQALATVYKEVRAERGDTEFNLWSAIAAIPDIIVDKGKLIRLYSGIAAMSEIDFERIRVTTENEIWLQFVTAHNAYALVRADIDALPRSPGAEKSFFIVKTRELIVFIKTISDKETMDEYANRLAALNNTDDGRSILKMKKPRKPVDSPEQYKEIDDRLYELEMYVYNNIQRNKTEIKKLLRLFLDQGVSRKTYAYRTGTRKEAIPVRFMTQDAVTMVRVLVFGDIIKLRNIHIGHLVFTSLPQSYTIVNALQLLSASVPGIKGIYAKWAKAMYAALESIIAALSEAGPTSVGTLIGDLVSVADSPTLRKDAAKLAKGVGHTCSAHPTYFLDDTFVAGPETANSQYAKIRKQIVDHVNERFDDHTRQMVQLALALKDLQIDSTHANTAAKLAVVQFTKNL